MEYLSADEVGGRRDACRAQLDALLKNRAVVGKPNARQWRFFRDCVERLLGGGTASEFEAIPAVQAAQFKFEVEDKLRRFYLRPGDSQQLVFTLAHESELHMYGLVDGETYPRLAGYCVLVRDLSEDWIGEAEPGRSDLALYLESVVSACMDAEFAAYTALPEIRLEEVRRWFCVDGPAYRDIVNLLTRHRQRGWIISNALNPSTKRLLDIRVKRIEGNTAMLATTEYWYLRWWGAKERSYVYPYRETSRQRYMLRKEAGGWKVSENLRPPPRSSVPFRWRSRRRPI